MDLPSAEERDDVVADLLEFQRPFHDFGMVARHLDGVVVAQEIGRVEHEDVERVALDPLAAVEQAAQRTQRPLDLHVEGALQRMDRAHLVGHGTDAADARRDIRRFVI